MTSQSFSDKTVLVTGSGGGLGKAIATSFLIAGANVVICDINASRLAEVEKELSPTHAQRVHVVQTDITDEAAVTKLFEETIHTFGRLDILINNAGIADKFDPVGDLDKALWDRVLAINLTAPYLTSKLAVNQMLAQEPSGGVIINVSSIGGLAGLRSGAAYTASKHGLLGLTKNTAVFYAQKGIRCNAICPGGMVTTNIADAFVHGINQELRTTILKKFGTDIPRCNPEKIAPTVLFLCSDAASEWNGACVPVDGGWLAA